MPVAFEELAGSPTIDITPEGTRAQRVFRVDWADWQEFAHEVVGRYRVVGCAFVFERPLEFPDMPNLVVSDLKVEPFDPGNPDGQGASTLVSGTNAYPAGARITATYETLFDSDNRPRADLPGVPEGTYLTYDADLGAEYKSIPGRVWHWGPGGPQLTPDVNPGVLIPTGTYRLTWHRVAMPAWDAIRQLRGKVNSGDFGGAPTGTVLFLGARVRRQFQFNETGGFWRVEYTFAERTVELNSGEKVGWNYDYKEQVLGGEHWVKIVDDDGRTPYQQADLSGLFQFGSC